MKLPVWTEVLGTCFPKRVREATYKVPRAGPASCILQNIAKDFVCLPEFFSDESQSISSLSHHSRKPVSSTRSSQYLFVFIPV